MLAIRMTCLFFIISISNLSLAGGPLACSKFYGLSLKNDNVYRFDNLPKPGTAKYKELVKQIQKQFQQNKSFALLDLREFLPKSMGQIWYNSMSNGKHGATLTWTKHTEAPSLYLNILDEWGGTKVPVRQGQIQSIENYTEWVRSLIFDAMKDKVPFSFWNRHYESQARLITEQNQGSLAPEWHVDGGAMSAILTIEGERGTEKLGSAPILKSVQEYNSRTDEFWVKNCQNCDPFAVPPGVLLVFSGSTGSLIGIPPLIHRSTNGRRLLFVSRF